MPVVKNEKMHCICCGRDLIGKVVRSMTTGPSDFDTRPGEPGRYVISVSKNQCECGYVLDGKFDSLDEEILTRIREPLKNY